MDFKVVVSADDTVDQGPFEWSEYFGKFNDALDRASWLHHAYPACTVQVFQFQPGIEPGYPGKWKLVLSYTGR